MKCDRCGAEVHLYIRDMGSRLCGPCWKKWAPRRERALEDAWESFMKEEKRVKIYSCETCENDNVTKELRQKVGHGQYVSSLSIGESGPSEVTTMVRRDACPGPLRVEEFVLREKVDVRGLGAYFNTGEKVRRAAIDDAGTLLMFFTCGDAFALHAEGGCFFVEEVK